MMLLISTSAAQMVLPVEIQLFKGADNSDNQDLRAGILIFLKGNATQKQQLMEKPERWASMEVWGIRNRHMKTGLPPQYVFYLKCLAKNCSHPLANATVILSCQVPGSLEAPHWTMCHYQSLIHSNLGVAPIVLNARRRHAMDIFSVLIKL